MDLFNIPQLKRQFEKWPQLQWSNDKHFYDLVISNKSNWYVHLFHLQTINLIIQFLINMSFYIHHFWIIHYDWLNTCHVLDRTSTGNWHWKTNEINEKHVLSRIKIYFDPHRLRLQHWKTLSFFFFFYLILYLNEGLFEPKYILILFCRNYIKVY